MVVEAIKDTKLIEKFLKYLEGSSFQDKRNHLLAKFQLNTGLRISDVVKVRYDDIFTEKGQFKQYFLVKEQKTDKSKKIKLNDALKKELKSYIKEYRLSGNDYLFWSRIGDEYITTTQAYRILKTAAKAVNIENFGTHSLRKSWGYWTYKASKYNIGLIMDMFNHASPSITLRYIGIDQDQKDELYSMVQF